MSNKRELLSKYVKVKDEQDIPGNFTSVRGEYMDPDTNRTGFYKLNGSFWGQPDLRELLASTILKKIGVPCADIQLVYDDIGEQDNGCLSMSILKPGEEFIEEGELWGFNTQVPDFGTGIDRVVGNDIYANQLVLPNLSPEFWEERKDFFINYAFISAFIGNDDIKTPNCQIIYNSQDGTYRNPEYYDMGMAFSGVSKGREFYDGKKDVDVLTEIYQKYPDKVKDISHTISETLTKDSIKEMLQDDVYTTLSPEERKRIWSELGDKIAFIGRANEQYYGDRPKSNGINIGHEDLRKASEKTPLNLKDKAARFFSNVRDKFTERND